MADNRTLLERHKDAQTMRVWALVAASCFSLILLGISIVKNAVSNGWVEVGRFLGFAGIVAFFIAMMFLLARPK